MILFLQKTMPIEFNARSEERLVNIHEVITVKLSSPYASPAALHSMGGKFGQYVVRTY